MNKNGIDGSRWQGDINWGKAKSDGVEFAILREGYGKESPNQKDKFFEANYSGCKNLEIPVGVYHYSYASSCNDAVLEAKFCLKNIDGKQLEYPVCFDIEDKTMLALSTGLRTDICKAFCDTIEDAGYYAMIYCNLDWYKNKIDGAGLAKKYDIWLAQWNVNSSSVSCGIWQKSDVGKIDGISGNVDLNESYKDYPEIMKSKGLNGYGGTDGNDKNNDNYKTYTVQKGDSLWAIAQKFMGDGTKWPSIKSLNGLKSDIIYPGQVLKIPKI